MSKSWTISDEFWETIKDLIQKPKRDENKKYKRKAGGGRKSLDPRKVLGGIFYILRTGAQWNSVPREYGNSSSIYRYFQKMERGRILFGYMGACLDGI